MLGVSPFPIPIDKKKPVADDGAKMAWADSYWVQLAAKSIPYVFAGVCNIGVPLGPLHGRHAHLSMFVIDCETAVSYRYHKFELREHDIDLFGVKTGSDKGGGHIYLTIEGDPVVNIPGGRIPGVEILGYRKYVLGACSRHPDGGIYDNDPENTAEIPPTVKLDKLTWFTDQKNKPVKLHQVSGRRRKPRKPYDELSQQNRKFLELGANEGDRNKTLFNVATDMHANGYSAADIDATAGQAARNSGLPDTEVQSTIKSATSQHRTRAQDYHDKAHKNIHAGRNLTANVARKFAQEQEWPRRQRTSILAVCEALAVCCEQDGEAAADNPAVLVFSASERRLSVTARRTRKTTHKVLRTLRDASYLALVSTSRHKGNKWQFGAQIQQIVADLRVEVCPSYPTSTYGTDGYGSGILRTHFDLFGDALERGVLGHDGARIYELLAAQALTRRGIEQALNMTAGAVRYALKSSGILRQRGLIQLNGRKYKAVPVTRDMLDRIAVKRDKFGAGQKRENKFQQERALRLESRIIAWRKKHDATNYHLLDDKRPPKPQTYHCSNCKQQIFEFDGLPDTCDFCGDMTTWECVK